jgi:hypothetical protein
MSTKPTHIHARHVRSFNNIEAKLARARAYMDAHGLHITDPAFKYVPACSTDITLTFERVRARTPRLPLRRVTSPAVWLLDDDTPDSQ